MKPPEDYYKILQVPHSADLKTIKVAYRKLAKKYHPDKNKSGDSVTRMQQINIAYQILSNPEKRRNYDFEWLQWERSNSPRSTPSNTAFSGEDILKQSSSRAQQREETGSQFHARRFPLKKIAAIFISIGFILLIFCIVIMYLFYSSKINQEDQDWKLLATLWGVSCVILGPMLWILGWSSYAMFKSRNPFIWGILSLIFWIAAIIISRSLLS